MTKYYIKTMMVFNCKCGFEFKVLSDCIRRYKFKCPVCGQKEVLREKRCIGVSENNKNADEEITSGGTA